MRYTFIISVFFVIWLSLLSRVFYLSINSNERYEMLSNHNTIKKQLIAPVRGEILDRNLKPIAINILGFKIALKSHLKVKGKDSELDRELKRLKQYFPKLSIKKMKKRYLKKNSYYFHKNINIVDFISYEDIMPYYTKLNISENVFIYPSPKRYYPNNQLAAHSIGYVSRANRKDIEKDELLSLIGSVGKNGIEKYYNKFLEGEAGHRTVKVSAYNEEIEQLSYKEAIEHKKLILNIDIELEKYISKFFVNKTGAVVVMDVNGSIIALGSYPEYDLNTFVSGISSKKWKALIEDVDTPFTNKLVNGLYPPGSTIKPGLGLIYVGEDGFSPWWTSTCTGSMKLGKRNFRCWKHKGHGKVNLKKAIRESCDDYFYKGSLKTGINKMAKGFKRYGLGKKTGIDLPHEFIGTVPSRSWKRERFNQPWYIGETLNTSIGQGDFLVTPVQMAQFTALMATGKLPIPHIAHKIGDKIYNPKPRDVLNEKELKRLPLIQRAMYEVCNHPKGTAHAFLWGSKVKMAGKTGTAQVVGISQDKNVRRLKEHEMSYYRRSHAWFTTYAPYKNPQYVITVLVEHGGHGGAAAGAIVSNIYNELLRKKYMTKN